MTPASMAPVRAVLAIAALVASSIAAPPASGAPRSGEAARRGAADRQRLERGEEVRARTFHGERERLEYAAGLLGRDLSKAERRAIRSAHAIGKGELGADGETRARILDNGDSNYTREHKVAKRRELRKVPSFAKKETLRLVKLGVVGEGEARTRGDFWDGLAGNVYALGAAYQVFDGTASANPVGFLGLAALGGWDPLESTCRHASLSIL